MKTKITVGTRKSRLALWQANYVKNLIQGLFPAIRVSLKEIKTTGDHITDVALSKIGDKGVFTKEIEDALLRNDIDIAVHSLKDLPTKLPDGLTIGAVTKREKPIDVFLSNRKMKFLEFPTDAKIGTSSLRRIAQLKALKSDFEYVDLRGNLETRVRKLQSGQYDGIVLAYAGVKRLQLDFLITEEFSPEIILPAVGQGSLAIEHRKEDSEVSEIISQLNDNETYLISVTERKFLEKLQGGCQVPIGAYSEIKNGKITLTGLIASLDGRKLIKYKLDGELNKDSCEKLGISLAEKLLQNGGKEILEEISGKHQNSSSFGI
ncbi:MAG: hydroxymethylbilane synthase [Candidatus Melainabacteria bacterium]|nr:hydroxymethylbilane synthase [Candidatus Melainabacteria bacterium]MBI3308742.1 hydroxymethylbilane synthase [Candidatus Melainabacteria bacterium]